MMDKCCDKLSAVMIVVFSIILAWSLVPLHIPERVLEPEKYGFTVIDDWGRPVTLEKK